MRTAYTLQMVVHRLPVHYISSSSGLNFLFGYSLISPCKMIAYSTRDSVEIALEIPKIL
jgi:hypothetical protein